MDWEGRYFLVGVPVFSLACAWSGPRSMAPQKSRPCATVSGMALLSRFLSFWLGRVLTNRG